ncbi:MAG: SOS response-associated peptidase [Candidatus Leucobacter sulfamidivorax]|nr:SOS response-associated peptidase [Candidatus Leucobacter sulfamidivorax]
MCGRYVLTRVADDLVPLFGIEHVTEQRPRPSFNIAPSEQIAIVLESAKEGKEGRRLESARWGLVPPFKKSLKDGPTPINARVETVPTSGMYRGAFAKRRAIIPASGFYERRKTGDRQSFYICPSRKEELLAFAGLYEWWRDPAKADDDPSRWVLSATILTHPPQGEMLNVHDREPLYLSERVWADWLDPHTAGRRELLDYAQEASADVASRLAFRPIGPAWLPTTRGSKVDDSSLIKPQVA